jgi:uncharacterized protein YcfJ
VNGNVVPTAGFSSGAIRAYGATPSNVGTVANLVVTLQECATSSGTFANALDNTGTVIGFTLTGVISVTGTNAVGSNVLTAVSSVTGLYVGQAIAGTGIPAGAVITAIGTTTLTISANATSANTSTALTFSVEGEARIEGLNLNRKPYLRAVITPSFTGGSSPAILGFAEIIMGGAAQLPTDSAVSNT